MMTSSTSSGLDLGAAHRLDDRDLAELVRRRGSPSPPLKAPIGVRAALAMTMSVMGGSPCGGMSSMWAATRIKKG